VGTKTGLAFALLCNSTIYDATYSWINGSFRSFTDLTPSNDTMAKIVNTPQQGNPFFGYPYYVSGAIVSAFSNTSQQVADSMAAVYSRITLGLVAAAFDPNENLVEQSRKSIVVSQVPYGPLYTLIGLNIFFAIFGFGIAVLALRRRRLSDVVSLFSISGIVAHAFEPPPDRTSSKVENWFKESMGQGDNKVGVEVKDQAWVFKIWRRQSD
jgi:hypothetical protein